MLITIVTVGSQGDVQPYVALGQGLHAAGFDVRVATGAAYEKFIRDCGLDFYPIEGNPTLDVMDQAGRETADVKQRFGFGHATARLTRPLLGAAHEFAGAMERHVRDCWRACQGTDAILYSPTAFFSSYSIAEKLGVPSFGAYVSPIHPTRAFPLPYVSSTMRLGGMYNRLTYSVGREVFWQLQRRTVNRARGKVLDLPPIAFRGPYQSMNKHRAPFLYGFSPALVPKPVDWGEWLHVVGFWFLERPSTWQPPADLVDFIAAGSPPVYVGFGSVTWKNEAARDALTDVVVTALGRARQRAIVLAGEGGLGSGALSKDVFTIASVPFDWLFPRMAAIVHHGGSGTTAEACRAGVPSVVIPFSDDHAFWAWRVCRLGVGPPPIRRKRLSAEQLADAISTAVTDEALRERAAALGARIRQEAGVARATELVSHALS